MLDAGTPFPTFSLAAHDGSIVSSDSLAGRAYLLYFYPMADTPLCTQEACAFRDAWGLAREAGMEVFGVSYDKPEKNRAFAEKHDLQFLLLSDSGKELAKSVGAATFLLPMPKRVSYLVGTDGTVLKAYPSVKANAHAAEVLEDFTTKQADNGP